MTASKDERPKNYTFFGGVRVPVPKWLAVDLAVARQYSNMTRPQVCNMINDANGRHPTNGALSSIESGKTKKIGKLLLNGVIQFIANFGPPKLAENVDKYEDADVVKVKKYEAFAEIETLEKKVNESEDRLDRMFAAFEDLDADEQQIICTLTERLAKASKVSAAVQEFTEKHTA